jgi:hypothetical protein
MKAQFFIISSVIMVYVIITTFQYLSGFSDIRMTSVGDLQDIYYIDSIKSAFIQTFDDSIAISGDYNRLVKELNYTENFFSQELLKNGIQFRSNFFLFSNGFENGDISDWTGNLTDSGCDLAMSQNPYNGQYALKAYVNGGSKDALVFRGVDSLETMYVRMYVMFDKLPNTDNYHVYSMLSDQNGNDIAWLYVDNWGGNRAFGVWDVVNDADYRWYTSVREDQWYDVEMKIVRGDSNGEIHLLVDGVERVNQTGIDTNSGYVYDTVYAGNHHSSEESTNYIDCFAVSGDYIGNECYPDGNDSINFNLDTNELHTSTYFSMG